jgi:NitT/TauT family transport system substrate-binding protein
LKHRSALALLAALLTATGAAQNRPQELRIGYLPNIVIPQPLVGFEGGAFARLLPGVALTGRAYPAGPAVLEALRAGALDIAYTGPYPPMTAFMKEKDVVLLAGAARGGTELVVAAKSPVKTVADLKGKVVGVNQFGSTVDAMVRFNLAKAGLSPDRDVRLIEVPPAEQADALKRGEVAAVAAPAPWPSYVVKNAGGRALLNWRTILDNGDYLQGVAFTTRKFAEANPDLVRRFVAAHTQVTNELNKDRARGDAQVLAAWSKATRRTLDPAVSRAAFASIKYTSKADLNDFERLADLTYQAGILREKGSLEGFLYNPNAKR